MISRILAVIALAMTASACALPFADRTTPATAAIGGTQVSRSLYDVLLSSAKHQAGTGGASLDPNQPAGARRLARVQASAMRIALRDTALERLAAGKGVTVSKDEVDAAIARVDQALGTSASLDGQLTQSGLSRSGFRVLMRYRLLERKLRARDPGLEKELASTLANGDVHVYAAPCLDDHRYPQCLDAVTAG
jgi:parvulin-like peptidyl-prolyl isomerase